MIALSEMTRSGVGKTMTAEFQDAMGYRNGKAIFKIVLPLPPTDNNIYINASTTKGGHKRSIRILSDEAKAYKRSTATEIADMAIRHTVQFRQNVPYLVLLRVFFENVENAGWATGKAKTRYKKVDTTNRGKLLIDSVTQAIGVDDSHIFPVFKFKDHDSDDPRVEAEVYELEEGEIDKLYEAVEEAIQEVLWA